MPEGPEIRRSMDKVAAAVSGRVAERVVFGLDRHKPYEDELSGRQVESVTARGKAALVHFAGRHGDAGWTVYSHNQLYGKWRTGSAAREPKTSRQLRFAIYGAKRAARLYSASDIRIVRPDDVDSIDYIARLGPDPVNQALDAADIAGQFDDHRFAGRNLGGLLLNQAFVAGIGNYLRSDILHQAGIHPARKPRELHEDERQRLIHALLELPVQAYELAGITNDPQRAARMKEEGVSFGARRHLAFTREGKPCYGCGTRIERFVQGGRRIYLCPVCQPD